MAYNGKTQLIFIMIATRIRWLRGTAYSRVISPGWRVLTIVMGTRPC